MSKADAGIFGFLPEGAAMYLWADVNEVRSLLEYISFDGLPLTQADAVLDRTETAAIALSGAGAGSRFLLSLRGKYPSFQAAFSMAFSREWKRTRSNTGKSYWNSEYYGIGLALDSQIALVSKGDPFEKVPASGFNAVRIPVSFDDFRAGTVMAGWIPDSQIINDFLSNSGLPIQIPAEDFFFGVTKSHNAEDAWEIEFHIRTSTVLLARGLVNVITLARTLMFGFSSGGSIISDRASFVDFLPMIFANPPQRVDDILTIKTDSFTTGELSLLFNIFLLYSS